jgi:hypothetical protein
VAKSKSKFYAKKRERSGIATGVNFRCLLLGYLGHSTISRMRRLIDLETHQGSQSSLHFAGCD